MVDLKLSIAKKGGNRRKDQEREKEFLRFRDGRLLRLVLKVTSGESVSKVERNKGRTRGAVVAPSKRRMHVLRQGRK